MPKPQHIALHAACILRKLGTGQPLAFHVRGILREFGIQTKLNPGGPVKQ